MTCWNFKTLIIGDIGVSPDIPKRHACICTYEKHFINEILNTMYKLYHKERF